METNMENQDHFIECADCGLLFDPSDLSDVFAHEHDNQAIIESGKYLGKPVDPPQ